MMTTHPSSYTSAEQAIAHLFAIFGMECTCSDAASQDALEGDCPACVAEDGIYTLDGHSRVTTDDLAKARVWLAHQHDASNLTVTYR